MSSRRLAQLLLSRAGPNSQELAAVPDLGGAVSRLLTRARAAWPHVDVDAERFVLYVAERLAAAADLGAALATVHAEDLYLACALAQRHPHAIREFEHRFLPEVSAYVARTQSSPAFAEDVKQVLREQLLVGRAGAPPKIASYAGSGPLGGWLRVVAVRLARNLLRAQKNHLALDGRDGIPIRSASPDPEMSYLKQRYGREFRQAFQSVLTSLPTQERTILRLFFFDGMTVNQIGALYNVHGSTVSRRIARSRQTIFNETRRLLHERLRLGSREFESLMALVQSRLDVSLCGLLGAEPARNIDE
jgi:RNA polymerase sigma-70 factor (ECF subfamily)